VYPDAVAAWGDEVKQAQAQAAKKLTADLAAATANNAKQFVIPPGDYRFGSPDLPALIIKASNMDIAAEGANFWYSGRIPQSAVSFLNCSNVQFHGATFDADPFCYLQGQILSIDPNSKTLLLRMDPGFPLPDKTWLAHPGTMKAIYFDPQGALRQTEPDWVENLISVGARDYRVTFVRNVLFTAPSQVAPGDRMALPDRSMGHVIALNRCKAVTLSGITIYAAPDMAITEGGGDGGNVYSGCKVIRRPGTQRMLACNADVFHSIQVTNGPLIGNCEFSFNGDDLINVHSFASIACQQTAPNTVLLDCFGECDLAVGGDLSFFAFKSMKLLGTAKITQFTPRPDLAERARTLPKTMTSAGNAVADIFRNQSAMYAVTLDHPLNVPGYAVVYSDLHAARGTVIRNNYLHDTSFRGIVLKCVGGTVTGNRLSGIGLPGIELATDHYFCEGPIPRDILVSGNTLTDVAISPWACEGFNIRSASILVGIAGDRQGFAADGEPIQNIRVENNQITRTPLCGVIFANTSNSAILNNTMDQLGSSLPQGSAISAATGPPYGVHVIESKHIQISGNQLTNPSAHARGAVALGALAEDCGPQN
jgi:hypothetical protein